MRRVRELLAQVGPAFALARFMVVADDHSSTGELDREGPIAVRVGKGALPQAPEGSAIERPAAVMLDSTL
jgi:hypothetical protein